MSGAIPPLPQHAYMVWCSVKAQGQFYCSFLFIFTPSRPALGPTQPPVLCVPVALTPGVNLPRR